MVILKNVLENGYEVETISLEDGLFETAVFDKKKKYVYGSRNRNEQIARSEHVYACHRFELD